MTTDDKRQAALDRRQAIRECHMCDEFGWVRGTDGFAIEPAKNAATANRARMAGDDHKPPPTPTFEACFHCGEILAQPPAWPFGYCDVVCLRDVRYPRKDH